MIFLVIILIFVVLLLCYLVFNALNKLYDIEDMILNLNERGGFDVFDITT